MKMSQQTKLAYAAGIIDGEGCICIYQKKIRNGKYAGILKNYHLQVIVTQKDGKLIDWLIGNFGGSAYLHWKGTPTGYSHEWVLNYQNAAKFLKQILPFLIYKKSQAEVAIRFQGRINVGQMKLNEHELSIRQKLYEEISRLKHISTYSQQPNIQKRINDAALTTK
jgi:hypothetical protein